MNISSHRLRGLLLASSVALGTATAQSRTPSVVRVNGDFRFGSLATTIPNPSTSGDPYQIRGERGTITLRNDLTCTATSNEKDVDVNQTINNSSGSDSGIYRVAPNGDVVLDFMPTSPGTDVATLTADTDLETVVAVRDQAENESFFVLGLRSSTGQTNGSVQGGYTFVSKFMEFDAIGLTTGVATGTATLDGSGGIRITGREERVDATGQASTRNVSGNGTYSVTPTGGFSFGPTEQGGISPDGDVFFVVDLDPTSAEVGFTVGVRIGSSYDLNALAGRWVFLSHEVELGTNSDQPNAYTERGVVRLAAQNATSGTFDGSSFEVDSNPLGVTTGTSTFSGTVAVRPNGVLQFTNSNGTDVAQFSFAQNDKVFIGTEFIGASNIQIGVRTCSDSGPFGTRTQGTGAIEPVAGIREFPRLGNANFALRVIDGLGGAPAAFAIGFGPSPGIPLLGGTIWLDPAQIIATPSLLLSGQAGAAGAGEASIPIPVPTTPTLDGAIFYFQTFVLDSGSPGGLAMTEGFRVELCR